MDLPVLRESKPYSVAASVVRKLQENGFVAYFAGGSIRDALRGTAPKDIDIATSA
jgi:tRNA nucleotidyltransferase/poly(A) polymerase